GMITAQDRTEVTNRLVTLFHARLIEVIAKEIHPIRSSEVVEAVAIEIRQRNSLRRLQKGSRAQILAYHFAILEWHPISICELQVGHTSARFVRKETGCREAFPIKLCKAHKAITPRHGNVIGRVIRLEELGLRKLIERNQRGKPSCHPSVASEGSMFRLRKFD